MNKRTNFNYVTATVAEIAEHFKTCSRQNIYAVRKSHKDDVSMTEKLNEALTIFKIWKIRNDIPCHTYI